MLGYRMKPLLSLAFAILASFAFNLSAQAYTEEEPPVYGPVYAAYDQPELGPVLGPPLPVEETREEPAPEPLKYIVASGDTLNKIARDFNITITALMVENGIIDPHRLSIGQCLTIPSSSEAVIPLPDGQHQIIKQVLSSTLTAYTAGAESTGKSPSHPAYGITYSGSKAEEGRTIAVDPKVIPIGSTVFIDGVGIRKAEDTGSAIRGARIDVFMNDIDDAVDFGVKRNVKVYILSNEHA